MHGFASRRDVGAMKRKRWRAALAAAALLAACLPCTVLAQNPNGLGPDVLGSTGSITVSMRDEQGRELALPTAAVSITASLGGPITSVLPQKGGEEWVFSDLTPGARYVVKVEATGFVTAQQFVELPNVKYASVRVDFYLVPADRENRLAKPAGGAILAPRAQKEVQKGIKDLEANKIHSAQKHLAKALKMAPGNPLVNFLMGESWLRAGKAEEATAYLEKAISLDPKQAQALVALGTLRYQQGDMTKAIELLKQAVETVPKLWRVHWLLAAAFLREGSYEQAREQAKAALKYGKEQADPVRVILGVALAKLGKRDKAIEMLSEYLKRHPDDRRAGEIDGLIAKLRQPQEPAPASGPEQRAEEQQQASVRPLAVKTHAATPQLPEREPAADLTVASTVEAAAPTPSALTNVATKESWVPPDVDAEKPERISDATCHLPQILKQAAGHAEELVSDLEKFSATEDFQEMEIGRKGKLHRPIALKFNYLVFIKHLRSNLPYIDEMRTPNPAERLEGGPLISTGVAALELVLHPDFNNDFAWKCEGMGEWEGQPAWMIHFEQRADRPTSRLHALATASGREYELALKGRVWVAANGNQVLHLETDLVRPLKEMGLEREHYAIDYGLVRFHTHPVALWLPETVDAYFGYRGHTYHQYSRFSHFELFWVGTGQKIAKPKEKTEKH
jgi:tetratricopeptide (TPR) repeat protein